MVESTGVFKAEPRLIGLIGQPIGLYHATPLLLDQQTGVFQATPVQFNQPAGVFQAVPVKVDQPAGSFQAVPVQIDQSAGVFQAKPILIGYTPALYTFNAPVSFVPVSSDQTSGQSSGMFHASLRVLDQPNGLFHAKLQLVDPSPFGLFHSVAKGDQSASSSSFASSPITSKLGGMNFLELPCKSVCVCGLVSHDCMGHMTCHMVCCVWHRIALVSAL